MQRWLYKMNYKYGNKYIRNLMTVIVVGMVAVYLLDIFAAPAGVSVSSYLSLNSAAVLRGQVWRLVTFIFVPPNSQSIFLLISLYFYYMMGRMLEENWGGFKLNLYYLFGIIGTIVGTFAAHFLLVAISGQSAVAVTGTNQYLNLSLFLAFASLAPDTQFLLFFIIPLKAKWLVAFYAVMLLIPMLQTFLFVGFMQGLVQLILVAFSLLNYFLFFGRTMINTVRDEISMAKSRRNWRNQNRR